MPFLTPLKLQLLNDRAEFPWLTLDVLVYTDKKGNIHTVPKYFRTDGSSHPIAIAAIPVIGPMLVMRHFGSGVFMGFEEGVLHDWARRKRQDGTRPMSAADAHLLFKEALEEKGYPEDLVQNYFAAVVKFNSKD